MTKARRTEDRAAMKDGRFSEGFDTLWKLGLHPGFSPEVAAAIRRKGGADRAIAALDREFGIGREPVPQLLPMISGADFDVSNVSTLINFGNFPLDEEGPYDASGLALFESGGREWSIGEVWEAIQGGGRRKLEGLVRGLAYLKGKAGVLLSNGPIVFPASAKSVPFSGEVLVPYAILRDGEPHLDVYRARLGEHLSANHRYLISINKRK